MRSTYQNFLEKIFSGNGVLSAYPFFCFQFISICVLISDAVR